MAQKRIKLIKLLLWCLPLVLSFAFLFTTRAAYAASLYLSPQTANEFVGQSFTLSVYVASPDQAMNAAQGQLSFPIDTLSVVSLSKVGSVVNLWVQEPSFSNKDGTINFEGVVVNPGFQGNASKILDITFRVRSVGAASVSFFSGAVLANDGKGTNILDGLRGATITLTRPAPGTTSIGKGGAVVHPVVTSTPPVNETAWYSINSITFGWKTPPDTAAMSYAISNNPDYQLSTTPKPFTSEVAYDLSQWSDGPLYFFLSFERGGEWTPATTKAFHIDRTPPEPFQLTRINSDTANLSNSQPAFKWAAVDKTSGIAYYRAKIGDGDWFDPEATKQGSYYVLPPQSPTDNRTLTVRAYDQAGNYRGSSIIFSVAETCLKGDVPCIVSSLFMGQNIFLVVLIVVFFAAAYWFIRHELSTRRRLRVELADFKNELRRDLKRLEEHFDARITKGTEVDLRPSRLEAQKEMLEKAAKQIETDVREEIKKVEKLVDDK